MKSTFENITIFLGNFNGFFLGVKLNRRLKHSSFQYDAVLEVRWFPGPCAGLFCRTKEWHGLHLQPEIKLEKKTCQLWQGQLFAYWEQRGTLTCGAEHFKVPRLTWMSLPKWVGEHLLVQSIPSSAGHNFSFILPFSCAVFHLYLSLHMYLNLYLHFNCICWARKSRKPNVFYSFSSLVLVLFAI